MPYFKKSQRCAAMIFYMGIGLVFMGSTIVISSEALKSEKKSMPVKSQRLAKVQLFKNLCITDLDLINRRIL